VRHHGSVENPPPAQTQVEMPDWKRFAALVAGALISVALLVGLRRLTSMAEGNNGSLLFGVALIAITVLGAAFHNRLTRRRDS
jgi:hypothetical protein